MDERTKFVGLVNSGVLSVAEICRRFEISRKTGYKWLARFDEEGAPGLKERSRAPKRRPWSLPQAMQDTLLELRRRRPTWGPRKLLAWLAAREPELELPAPSTVGDLFKRKGLTGPRRRRRFPQRATPTGLVAPLAPNDCWCVDFKGNFVLEHQRCHPLTVTDAFSRFLIGCQALKAPQTALAKPVFRRLFVEYGLPTAIRSDNGAPFASTGLGGLSVLSVWWIRLGIRLERIPPGQPQHNGRHERMHRTLKAETIRPPEATFAAQQKRFDEFRLDYNSERPHEALNNKTPAAIYTPSIRTMSRVLPEIEYPSHFELRAIRRDGMMKLRSKELYVSVALNEEVVGLEEIDDDIWRLYFGPICLAIVSARGKRLGLVPAPDETTLSMTEKYTG